MIETHGQRVQQETQKVNRSLRDIEVLAPYQQAQAWRIARNHILFVVFPEIAASALKTALIKAHLQKPK